MKKVAIIGATDSCKDAPFDDPSWEIWGCNSLWKLCRDSSQQFRADRWFELHPMSVQTEEELIAIRVCPVPIYTLTDESSWAPNSVVFPILDILKRFPYRYFTCTFAYQIALALHEGFSEIGLYGVDLSFGTARERVVEKACVEFWAGVACGVGVNIRFPSRQPICNQRYLYGYDYHDEISEVNKIMDGVAHAHVASKYKMMEGLPR